MQISTKLLKAKYKNLLFSWKNARSVPNPSAILVFGMQKSGTSAIANLLAAASGKTLTCDTPVLWDPNFTQIINHSIDFNKHIERFSLPFSREIIKEPNLTFLTNQARNFFSLSKYVFVVRNPYTNIRSILNRLNLDGNKKNLDLSQVSLHWRQFFNQNRGLDYVGTLAKWWVKANDQPDFINNTDCCLIRYEDFLTKKDRAIYNLAREVRLNCQNSIDDLVDIQFQPKGKNTQTPKDFFGKENYQKIMEICGEVATRFGYNL